MQVLAMAKQHALHHWKYNSKKGSSYSMAAYSFWLGLDVRKHSHAYFFGTALINTESILFYLFFF